MKRKITFDVSKFNAIAQRFIGRSVFLQDYAIPALFMILFLSLVLYRFNYLSSHYPFYPRDFHFAYYPAGHTVLDNPANLYRAAGDATGFVNLPIVAYLFTPISLLNEYSAAALFTFLSVVSVFIAGYFLIKMTGASGWKRAGIIVLITVNAPLFNSIKEGNTTHFIFLLLLGCFFCFRSKQDIWSGILLAIAALIKIPLSFLILYFVMRRRWRVLAAFFGVLLAVISSSLLLFGLNLNLIWLDRCILAFSGRAIGISSNQSIDGFLIRLLTNCSLDNAIATEVDWRFKLMRYILLSLLLGGTIGICWYSKQHRTPEVEGLEFSIFLCLALLISPISWEHYYLLLLLPFSLCVSNKLAIPRKLIWVSLILLSALMMSLPPIQTAWFNNSFFTILARAFLISTYFWSGIVLLTTLLAARWQVGRSKNLLAG